MRKSLLLCLLALSFAARADEDAEGCKDSQAFTRMPGSYINNCEKKEFDEVEIAVGYGKDNERQMKTVKGQVEHLVYDSKANTSQVQVQKNYEAALKKNGFTIVLSHKDDNDERFLTGRKGPLWIAFRISPEQYDVTVAQEKGMKQEVQVDASALLEELNTSGRVAVYGINFDTGKATLKPDSTRVLEQVAKLLKDNGELKLRVEGHTDNQGKAKDNLELSKKRAEAVADWLAKSGVDKARLKTDGLGDTKAVGDNSTDEGRAKNRRVELVKL